MKKKYYLVLAKCGHVGRGNYMEVTFSILAESAHDAAQIVLKRPKVKKHLKNAITNVVEVEYDVYRKQLDVFNNNGYVKSHTKKEVLEFMKDVLPLESNHRHYKTSFVSRMERVNYLLKKNRIKEAQMAC